MRLILHLKFTRNVLALRAKSMFPSFVGLLEPTPPLSQSDLALWMRRYSAVQFFIADPDIY